MAVSKAQQKAVTKYIKNTYDRFGLTMPKGHLDTIKAAAAAAGESVNAYINTAITRRMEPESPSEATGGPQEAVPVFLGPETLQAALEAAEVSGEALQQFIDRAVEETADNDAASKEAIFARAVDAIAEHYRVSRWDILKELEKFREDRSGMADKVAGIKRSRKGGERG